MNKKSYLLFIILSLALVVTACSKPKDSGKSQAELPDENKSDTSSPVEQLISINELYSFKKTFLIAPSVDIESYMDKDQDVGQLIDLTEQINRTSKTYFKDDISKEDAISDIELYFKLLETGYGGYAANGGKSSFDEAKSKVIEKLPEKINTRHIEDLLNEELNFINDKSLTIGSNYTLNLKWAHDKDMKIGKDDAGYYELINGSRISNLEEIEGLLKPSISDKGELYYSLYAFEDDKRPEKLIFEDGTSRTLKFDTITPSNSPNNNPKFSNEKIPYLSLRSFPSSDNLEANQLIENALTEIKEAEISILDLRGNMNGHHINTTEFFKSLTGEEIVRSSYDFSILNEKLFGPEYWEEYINLLDPEILDENHCILRPSDSIITNPNKLIILVDQYTMSFSEALIDSLHHVENTLFIGTPTLGAISNPAIFGGSLDKTKLYFSFGNSWNLYQDDYYQESRGFEPDIWLYNFDADKLIEILYNIK